MCSKDYVGNPQLHHDLKCTILYFSIEQSKEHTRSQDPNKQ